MNLRPLPLGFVALMGLCCLPATVRGQAAESQTVIAAADVLQSFTAFRTQSIPHSMLADAQAIALIPNVVKGGFVIAGRFGRGVVLVRNQDGSWRTPIFITFTGGSVGWQVGLQSTDIVLVFKNRKGVETMLNGSEFTLGADAAIAAGPVGRQATAGTDMKLNAEIYSYSRSRGLFAGVALDGSVMKVDQRANAIYYGHGSPVPEPAMQLVSLVARDTSIADAPPGTVPVVEPGATLPPTATPEQVRLALADASRKLDPLVDESWRKFLALPAVVFVAGPLMQPPARTDLAAALARYDRVATDATYKVLAERAEFRTVHDLLRRYVAAIDAAAAAPAGLSQLPPPPMVNEPATTAFRTQ